MFAGALKNMVIDRVDLDEAVAYLVVAESMIAKYDELEIEQPEWLGDKVKLLQREIRDRNHDTLLAKIRRAKASLEGMKPAEVKRAELAKEIKRMEAALGQ